MADRKSSGDYGDTSATETSGATSSDAIKDLADAILAALRSGVGTSAPGLTPAEERDIAFAEAALANLTAGLSLKGSAVGVTGVSPSSGPAGQSVTISGNNFFPGLPVNFDFKLAENVSVVSPTEIRATAPVPVENKRPLNVTLTVGASAETIQFTYT